MSGYGDGHCRHCSTDCHGGEPLVQMHQTVEARPHTGDRAWWEHDDVRTCCPACVALGRWIVTGNTRASRAEALDLFRHLPDPEEALAATEWVVADHARRATAATLGLQGLSERPEVFDHCGRRVGDVAPAYGAPSGSEWLTCGHRWPDEGDTLGRPYTCGLLGSHPGPHQAIGYHTSYYDDQGAWHTGGTTVLAEAPEGDAKAIEAMHCDDECQSTRECGRITRSVDIARGES